MNLIKSTFTKSGSKYIRGQSLYEVVFALGIVSLVLVAAIALSTTGVRNASFARNNSLATKYAQEGTEFLRQQRDINWLNFRNQTGTRAMGRLVWPPGGSCQITEAPTFCRQITMTASTDTVDAIVEVSWTDGQGTHRVRSATSYTRWK